MNGENVRFLAILDEAKTLFTNKSNDCERLLTENARLSNEVGLLTKNKQELVNDKERTITQLTKLKMFIKNFFTELRTRITEVTEKGIYNAETFSYLIGDIGRSLCETSFSVSEVKSPIKKPPSKLSTNKEKSRTRYKIIPPKLDLDNLSKTSTIANQHHTPIKNNVRQNLLKDTTNAINYLHEDATLNSPIGPPSRTSTPQGPRANYEPSSPSLLQDIPASSMDNIDNPLLSQLHQLEHEIPEWSEPQSPTIPSRSRTSMTSYAEATTGSTQDRASKRNWTERVSFSSLLDEPKRPKNNSSDENQQKTNVKENVKDVIVDEVMDSPDLIMVDTTGEFARPDPMTASRTNVVQKTDNCIENHSGSISLFSFQESSSNYNNNHDSRHLEKDNVEKTKSKLVFSLEVDTSGNDESAAEGNEENEPKKFKYIEVVRKKDERAKLNGYFCTDCEKYYGSLKLTEKEIQERLKACSRHRARFSPPPSTPEHFWDPGFMDTNDYIEKGFMKTGSELPPEKRRLKSRKNKGKSLKYNN